MIQYNNNKNNNNNNNIANEIPLLYNFEILE